MEFIELLKAKRIRFEKTDERLIVYDKADLSYSKIKEFPKCSMIFLRDLNIHSTLIKNFPNYSITVCGIFDITDTSIKRLSSNIVCDYLNINANITKIPKGLKASRIYVPVEGESEAYINRNGTIGICWKEKTIEEWESFFNGMTLFDYPYNKLSPEEYNIIRQDSKTVAKLLKSWI